MPKGFRRLETFENEAPGIQRERWSVLHYARVKARKGRRRVVRCKRCGRAFYHPYCTDCLVVLDRWYADGVWRSPESARREVHHG